MTEPVKLRPDAIVLVCDGHKALILRNEGDELFPNLRVQEVIESPLNPPSHEQGTDRPGRIAYGTHRSAVEGTDFHREGEHVFAEAIVTHLEATQHSQSAPEIIIAAPPRMLAAVRQLLPTALKALVRCEIDKDLTKYTVYEIERRIAGPVSTL